MIEFAGYGNGFYRPFKLKSANGLPFEPWDGVLLNEGSPSAASGAEVYGSGTHRPFGLTFPQMVKLFWRIKKLRIFESYTFCHHTNRPGSDPPPVKVCATYGPDSSVIGPIRKAAGNIPLENERQLCEPHDKLHYGSGSLASDGSWFNIDYSDVWQVGDLYYPKVFVAVGPVVSVVEYGYGQPDTLVDGVTLHLLDWAVCQLWGNVVLTTVGKYPPYSGTGDIVIQEDAAWGY